MRTGKFSFAMILLSFISAGCMRDNNLSMVSDHFEVTTEKKEYSIISGLEKSLATANIRLTTRADSTHHERLILEKINSGEEDLALIKNSLQIDDSYPEIRTVMPMFPEVFLALCRSSCGKFNFDSLVAHGNVVFITGKEEEQQLIDRFLNVLSLNPTHRVYANVSNATQTIDEADVILMFSSLNNSFLKRMLAKHNEFKIYDFNASHYQYGSVVDGFCMRFSQAIPFTIPSGIFDKFPQTPVQTFAVYDVLVCNRKLENEVIYDAIEAIFNYKARLAQENFEFAMLKEDFDNHTFLFPLHGGTIDFINRNQPTFWERYAELIGLAVSLLAISAGALSTGYRRFRQRRKDKIDEYYMRVISIGTRSQRNDISRQELDALHDELLKIRFHVFKLLVDEKISPNTSFVIFVLLAQSTLQDLELRQRSTSSMLMY